MYNPVFNLPRIEFIGGECKTFLFRMFNKSGSEFDATGCRAELSLLNYGHTESAPVLVKNATVQSGDSSAANVVSVRFDIEDTIDLYGRYIYQVSVISSNDLLEIPGQGIMDIRKNIHPEFASD